MQVATDAATRKSVGPAKNDDRFWEALARWKAADDSFVADGDYCDEYEKQVAPLFTKMVRIPVETAAAFLAKFQVVQDSLDSFVEGLGGNKVRDVLLWDAERLAKQELLVS